MTRLREIQGFNIESFKNLAPPHPVFLVTFVPNPGFDDQIVIKAETGGAKGRYIATAEIMTYVSPSAVSEALTEYEMRELKKAQSRTTPLLKQWLNDPHAFFVKMKYKKRFKDLQKPTREGFTEEQKATLKDLMPKLKNNQKVWESLGEIVAGDLFVGNADRIVPRKDPWVDEEAGPQEAMLQNAGNIFLKFNKFGQLKKTLALDNFDPFGLDLHSGDVTVWINDFKAILMSGQRAGEFASSVVDQFVGHGKAAGVSVELGDNEKVYFLAGFARGIENLKAYVKKKGARGLPPGAVSRATQLGWL